MLCALPGQARGFSSVQHERRPRFDLPVAYQYANICDPVNAPLTCLKFIDGKTIRPETIKFDNYMPCSKHARIIANSAFYCKEDM
jgi:hypothetical protein